MIPVSNENTIDATADAMDALTKMHKCKLSRLIVIENGRLAGMIALKDLLDLLALEGR